MNSNGANANYSNDASYDIHFRINNNPYSLKLPLVEDDLLFKLTSKYTKFICTIPIVVII